MKACAITDHGNMFGATYLANAKGMKTLNGQKPNSGPQPDSPEKSQR
jgi:DNA polymerase III alpha subunit